MKVTAERVRRRMCNRPGCSVPEVIARGKVPAQQEIEILPCGEVSTWDAYLGHKSRVGLVCEAQPPETSLDPLTCFSVVPAS